LIGYFVTVCILCRCKAHNPTPWKSIVEPVPADNAPPPVPPWPELLRDWMDRLGHEVSTAAPELRRSTVTLYQWLDGHRLPRTLDAEDLADSMGLPVLRVRLSLAESRRRRHGEGGDDV